jgi:hypothetical protein
MRLELIKKPEGEWCSFNEACGTGDGGTKEFKTPIPAAEARSVLILRDFLMTAPDNRLVMMNEKDGTVIKDDADGYKLETRGVELWVVFDRAPGFGTHISASGLGRKIGDAFLILPMTTVLQKRIQEKVPLSVRKREKDISLMDLQDGGRINFDVLVVDWIGIEGDAGPIPCDPITKKAFLDQMDAMFFGYFVMNRASAIRAERINALPKDSTD